MTQAAVLAVARETFDVELAREEAAVAMSLLSDVGIHAGTGAPVSTTPAILDVNGDGRLEMYF